MGDRRTRSLHERRCYAIVCVWVQLCSPYIQGLTVEQSQDNSITHLHSEEWETHSTHRAGCSNSKIPLFKYFEDSLCLGSGFTSWEFPWPVLSLAPSSVLGESSSSILLLHIWSGNQRTRPPWWLSRPPQRLSCPQTIEIETTSSFSLSLLIQVDGPFSSRTSLENELAFYLFMREIYFLIAKPTVLFET